MQSLKIVYNATIVVFYIQRAGGQANVGASFHCMLTKGRLKKAPLLCKIQSSKSTEKLLPGP
jgi:hypothetical protein